MENPLKCVGLQEVLLSKFDKKDFFHELGGYYFRILYGYYSERFFKNNNQKL